MCFLMGAKRVKEKGIIVERDFMNPEQTGQERKTFRAKAKRMRMSHVTQFYFLLSLFRPLCNEGQALRSAC